MKTTNESGVDAWLDGMGHGHAPMREGSRLRAIGAALTELERAQENLDRAVQDAKDAGESWSAIGVVLGTSRQAAHKKFSRPERINNGAIKVDPGVTIVRKHSGKKGLRGTALGQAKTRG